MILVWILQPPLVPPHLPPPPSTSWTIASPFLWWVWTKMTFTPINSTSYWCWSKTCLVSVDDDRNDTLWSLHLETFVVPYTNPGGKCIISNSPAASCRDRCFLTNDPDRGCVSTTVSVEPTIQCSYNNRQLRIHLEDHKNQWAKQFKARRISLDECIQDERSWIIVSILTPIVILVFFVAAFLIVKLIIKPRSRQRSFQKTREYEEKQRLSKSKTSFQAGRAYSNHLEVLDQDDEYW